MAIPSVRPVFSVRDIPPNTLLGVRRERSGKGCDCSEASIPHRVIGVTVRADFLVCIHDSVWKAWWS